MDISKLGFDIGALHAGYRNRVFSPADVVREAFRRIHERGDDYVWTELVCEQTAIEAAHRLETEFQGKVTALRRLSDDGKLYKATNPVDRDPNITKDYRQNMIDRIYRQYNEQNPEFYAFYRSLDAYVKSFKNKSDVLVLEPNSEFFKYLKNSKPSK